MASINPKPVQIHIWVQKKPDMTREQFIDYWQNTHGAIFMSFPIVKKHCIRYEMYQDDPAERRAVETALGLEETRWDGLAVLTFDSKEGAEAVYRDPEFVKFATDDEPRFCKYPDITKRIAVIGKPHVAHQR